MLQVNELNQYYSGSHILRGVTFDAPNGEVTCLLGRNGVGKTTLLKCLMGLVPGAAGRLSGRAKKSRTRNHIIGCSPAWRMCRRGAKFSRV